MEPQDHRQQPGQRVNIKELMKIEQKRRREQKKIKEERRGEKREL